VIECWKEKYPDIALALTWLLGKFDKKKENWDTLFPVERDEGDNSVQQVIKLLDEPKIPMFGYFSRIEKRQLIEKNVNTVLKHELMDPKLRVKLEELLRTPPSGELLKQLFNGLQGWLNAIEEQHHSIDQLRSLVIVVKKLIGCLVLSAVDDTVLLHTIHQLNRVPEDACLELKQKSDSSFQIVVSAIANTPPLFRYTPASQGKHKKEVLALQGEGELVLHERGVCKEKYYATFADEAMWLTSYSALVEQMAEIRGVSPGSYDDLASVSDAIEGFLWGPDKDDYYLGFLAQTAENMQ
jgi:hypothetical protein